jgi:peptide/nickel transport system substrate-binding protein
MRPARLTIALLVSVCALVSGGGSQATARTTRAVAHDGVSAGGVYRVEWESSFDFTDGFDPTGEYLGEALGIYSNLLVRTLVGYDHRAGLAGNRLVPDLATDLGTISNGGRTYTFHLRRGIRFGPPLGRAITSKDISYAFERIGTPTIAAQYGFYYDVIQGMAAFEAGKARSISGIATPDARTISFTLTVPTGDFRYRLGMPAAGPIPREVASCFPAPNRYGRYVIASGPYQIAGSSRLDASSCKTIESSGPISGFDGSRTLDLVRNPDYDPKTDSPSARENLPDEFVFSVDSNTSDIYERVSRGDADDEVANEPPAVLRDYRSSPRLHRSDYDALQYLDMNLTQPPFDDLHVRRAVAFVVDRDALRKAWGGTAAGAIATHIAPNSLLLDELASYAPFGNAGTGDLAAAKAEMRQSRYDANHDGICDATACKHVYTVTGDLANEQAMLPTLGQNLATIGITLKDRVLKDAYTPTSTPRLDIAFSTHPGWGKDYADPLTYFSPLFDGRGIIPTGNSNYSLVGLTPATAKQIGVTGSIAGVPSVDAALDRCSALAGKPRVACYAALDRTISEKIVPWVPYLWPYAHNLVSSRVTQWGWDQFGDTIAYAHVAVG